MTHLGNILIRSRIPAGDAADVIWRNADLAEVDFTAVAPSDALVDELLLISSGGPVGECIARLVPARAQAARMVTHMSAPVRLGSVRNRLTTRDQLNQLSADPDASVVAAAHAELVRRDDLQVRCANGEFAAACELLRAGVVEEIEALLHASSSLLAAAVASEDVAVQQLRSLDDELFARIAVTVLGDDACLIPYAVAEWSCSDDPLAAPALAGALSSRTTLRRRCTPAALRVLAAAGHVKISGAPEPRKTHTRLEDMLLVLEPFELAGLFFSSQDSVSAEVTDLIFGQAPVSLVVNFLLGQTPRRPRSGEVTQLLASVDGQRRTELSVALEEALSKAEQANADANPLAGFPWSGELLLCLQRSRALTLSAAAATDLYRTIDDVLCGDALAWEYLLALEGEWESSLFDLVISAAHMEGISALL